MLMILNNPISINTIIIKNYNICIFGLYTFA